MWRYQETGYLSSTSKMQHEDIYILYSVLKQFAKLYHNIETIMIVFHCTALESSPLWWQIFVGQLIRLINIHMRLRTSKVLACCFPNFYINVCLFYFTSLIVHMFVFRWKSWHSSHWRDIVTSDNVACWLMMTGMRHKRWSMTRMMIKSTEVPTNEDGDIKAVLNDFLNGHLMVAGKLPYWSMQLAVHTAVR